MGCGRFARHGQRVAHPAGVVVCAEKKVLAGIMVFRLQLVVNSLFGYGV